MRKRQVLGIVVLVVGICVLVFNILKDHHVHLGIFDFIYDIMEWFSFSAFFHLIRDSFSSIFDFIGNYFWCLLLIVAGALLIYSSYRSRKADEEGYYVHQEKRRLYRSKDDRKFLGVCAGLAHYWGIDPTIVRIAVLFLFFLFSTVVLCVYLLLAVILPVEESGEHDRF